MAEWHKKQRFGYLNPASRLTPAEVRQVRAIMRAVAFSQTFTVASVAREFGVSRQALYHIANGRNWGRLA